MGSGKIAHLDIPVFFFGESKQIYKCLIVYLNFVDQTVCQFLQMQLKKFEFINAIVATGYLFNNTTPIICGGYAEAEGNTQLKCYALESGRV